MAEHGTATGYAQGCRCEECQWARADSAHSWVRSEPTKVVPMPRYRDPDPACAGAGDSWGEDRPDRCARAAMAAICGSCPWLVECADYSLHTAVDGYWAGTTTTQRRQWRAQARIVPALVGGPHTPAERISDEAVQLRARRAARRQDSA